MLRDGSIVRAPWQEQPRAGRFEHEAHACVHGLQCHQVGFIHQPRIRVWKKRGAVQDEPADSRQVIQHPSVAQPLEDDLDLGKNGFGRVPQAEERFGAAKPRALSGNREHLLRRHDPPVRVRWITPERAVPTAVPTEVRQRQEHLAGVGNRLPFASVTQERRSGQQRLKRRRGIQEENRHLARKSAPGRIQRDNRRAVIYRQCCSLRSPAWRNPPNPPSKNPPSAPPLSNKSPPTPLYQRGARGDFGKGKGRGDLFAKGEFGEFARVLASLSNLM